MLLVHNGIASMRQIEWPQIQRGSKAFDTEEKKESRFEINLSGKMSIAFANVKILETTIYIQ